MENEDAAFADLSKVIEFDPRHHVAYYYRSRIYMDREEYAKALEDCNSAVKYNVADADYFAVRGGAYFHLNQVEQAIENFKRALEIDPQHRQAKLSLASIQSSIQMKQNKDPSQSLKIIEEAIKDDPKDPEGYHLRGLYYANQKQYKKAIEDYNKAIELNPKYAEAYNSRGDVYRKLGEEKKAMMDYARGMAFGGKGYEAKLMQGIVLVEEKKYKEALESLNEAVKLKPKESDAHFHRGECYKKLKQYDKALEDYNRAIVLNPKNSTAYVMRGQLYGGFYKKWKEALEDLEKAQKLDPELLESKNVQSWISECKKKLNK
jgi:tetratricopeptide (TPR) repeat protein